MRIHSALDSRRAAPEISRRIVSTTRTVHASRRSHPYVELSPSTGTRKDTRAQGTSSSYAFSAALRTISGRTRGPLEPDSDSGVVCLTGHFAATIPNLAVLDESTDSTYDRKHVRMYNTHAYVRTRPFEVAHLPGPAYLSVPCRRLWRDDAMALSAQIAFT